MTAGSRVWVTAEGALAVQAVRASDAGEYTCVVTSPGGNHTRHATLSVIELPFAPTNVRAVRLEGATQRAVNVSWTSGFDGNSPIQKFIVMRRVVPEFGQFKRYLRVVYLTSFDKVLAAVRLFTCNNRE